MFGRKHAKTAKEAKLANEPLPPPPQPTPPPPPPEIKATGVITRREVLLQAGSNSSYHVVHLSVRLDEGEGWGTKRDTIVCNFTHPSTVIAVLREGDAVTVVLVKENDGRIKFVRLEIDCSIYSESPLPPETATDTEV